ncbi:glycosyltransferase [Novosphingobium rosa]|uniref:glycosyltransferase n=1 Tax=Novosphingobium rosa TaxID=76978 RepID=UPI00082E5C3B|nr:glycosyltransferase [Novosphingobium rosa]
MADNNSPQVVFAITHTTPGGLREIWQDVAHGLSERGFATGLLGLYPQAAGEAAEAQRDGWRFIATSPLRNAAAGLTLLAATIGWLRRHRPQVVITAMPLANVLFPLAATLAGVRTKVVLSHHTPSFTYQGALNQIDRWTGCLPCVAAIVSVSDAVGASFESWPKAYRTKQRTIHNALPEGVERMVDAIAAGPARNSATQGLIVAVGRLSRQKNHPQLIRAMALLPKARLEIIGAGEDEAELRALIGELKLADRVSLLGQMPREAALRRAARADVFAQVSLFEGHSLALIEAARLGLPLVVSQVPVQIEGVTGEDGQLCGLTVPLDDPQALADALGSLLGDPATHRLWAGRSARLGMMRGSKALIDRYVTLLGEHAITPHEASTAQAFREVAKA